VAVKIQTEGNGPDWNEFLKSFQNASTKIGLREAAKTWHRQMLPRHFVLGAARRYNFKSRSAAYQKRKRRRGGPPALVWMGDLKRDAISGATVRTISDRVHATMRVPWYAKMVKKNPKLPNIPEELTTLRKEEAEELGEIVRETAARHLESSGELAKKKRFRTT